MSTAPSLPLENWLWSIQTRVEYCTLMASSDQSRKLMFRTITVAALAMFSPPPVIAAPEPTPIRVLFEATFCMPEIEIVPDTRMTAGLDDCMAEISADELVTVTGDALPPPVVPPPCVAHPARSNGAAEADCG